MGRTRGSERPTFARAAVCAATVAVVALLSVAPAAAYNARLGWGPVPNVAGYRLYVRQSGQSYNSVIDVGMAMPMAGVVSHVVHSLPNGITNYFSVSAYDALGREGNRSNELSIVVGTPIATATPTRTATARAATASPTRSARPSGSTRTPTALPNTTGTAVFTPTALPSGRRRVRFKKERIMQGETVNVPLIITRGGAVRFLSLVATYDAGVATAGPVTLAADAPPGSLSANLSTPGTLSLSAELVQPTTERGVLLEVPFTAVGECRSKTDIEITACVLDGGAVTCKTRNGRIRVRCARGDASQRLNLPGG